MKIYEQLECWTLRGKMNARTGGEKGWHVWSRLVQKTAEGKTSYELSWKVKVIQIQKLEKFLTYQNWNKIYNYTWYNVHTRSGGDAARQARLPLREQTPPLSAAVVVLRRQNAQEVEVSLPSLRGDVYSLLSLH